MNAPSDTTLYVIYIFVYLLGAGKHGPNGANVKPVSLVMFVRIF